MSEAAKATERRMSSEAEDGTGVGEVSDLRKKNLSLSLICLADCQK